VKRKDISPGVTYIVSSRRDPLEEWGGPKFVIAVDTEPRRELGSYEIDRRIVAQGERIDRDEYVTRRAAWRERATIDERFPLSNVTGETGILVKELRDNNTFAYKIVATRDLRMTKAEYLVQKKERDERKEASRKNDERLKRERQALRKLLTDLLDDLGIAYQTIDDRRRGGQTFGGIGPIQLYGFGYATDVRLTEAQLYGLLLFMDERVARVISEGEPI